MSKHDVTYVLAACGVQKHFEHGPQQTDRLCYLRDHFELLRPLADQYARVVVVNSGADPALSALARTALPSATVLERPNEGMSYGAFQAAIRAVPSAYYMLMEDDYVLTTGPDALVEYLHQHPRCSMYTGSVTDHASVFAGVVRREATDYWLSQTVHGGKEYGTAGYLNQIEVSHWLEHDGWELHDWLNRWASAFWISGDRCVRWYSRPTEELTTRLYSAGRDGDITRPSLLLPLQALAEPVRVSDGRRWHTGRIASDGRLMC
jgi:hypothetical protein